MSSNNGSSTNKGSGTGNFKRRGRPRKIRHGEGVRPDDGKPQTANRGTQPNTNGAGGATQRSSGVAGNLKYDFVADGDINGGAGGGDRGRGRANSGSGDSTSPDAGATTRRERGREAEEIDHQSEPVPIRLSRGKKKKRDKLETAATVGMLASCCVAVYGTTAFFLGRHWALSNEEALYLAEPLDKAIQTLPTTAYKKANEFIQKYGVWVEVGLAGIAVTTPRIIATIAKPAVTAQRQNIEPDNTPIEQTQTARLDVTPVDDVGLGRAA